MDKPMEKIINDQLDIKIGQFTEETQYWKKIKNWKPAGLNEILLKFRCENLTTYFDYVTQYMNKTQQRNEKKDASFPFPKRATSESLKTTKA